MSVFTSIKHFSLASMFCRSEPSSRRNSWSDKPCRIASDGIWGITNIDAWNMGSIIGGMLIAGGGWGIWVVVLAEPETAGPFEAFAPAAPAAFRSFGLLIGRLNNCWKCWNINGGMGGIWPFALFALLFAFASLALLFALLLLLLFWVAWAPLRSTSIRQVGHVCWRWNQDRRQVTWNMWLHGSFLQVPFPSIFSLQIMQTLSEFSISWVVASGYLKVKI